MAAKHTKRADCVRCAAKTVHDADLTDTEQRAAIWTCRCCGLETPRRVASITRERAKALANARAIAEAAGYRYTDE